MTRDQTLPQRPVGATHSSLTACPWFDAPGVARFLVLPEPTDGGTRQSGPAGQIRERAPLRARLECDQERSRAQVRAGKKDEPPEVHGVATLRRLQRGGAQRRRL